MKIILASSNPIYHKLEEYCNQIYNCKVIHSKDELNSELLTDFKPEYIFFLHWSFIIPKAIHENFNCVVFHMTDLPFGRGGSPLQNLIDLGHTTTKLSALKVANGIDTGDIYLKKELSLTGSAKEIFLRAADIMQLMIAEIIENKLVPKPQEGELYLFKRRTTEQSNLIDLNNLNKVYDYIRMLDAEGYPPAFLETQSFKFEFSNAVLQKDEIFAYVKISNRNNNDRSI